MTLPRFTNLLAVIGMVAMVFPSKVTADDDTTKARFERVSKHLDAPEKTDLYMYISGADWAKLLEKEIKQYALFATAMGMNQTMFKENVERTLDMSGLRDLSGIGVSSVKLDNGLFRNRAAIVARPGKQKGVPWRMFGMESRKLTFVDWLPENTMVAAYSEINLSLLWKELNKTIDRFNVRDLRRAMQRIEKEWRERGLDLRKMAAKLPSEHGIIVTMDGEPAFAAIFRDPHKLFHKTTERLPQPFVAGAIIDDYVVVATNQKIIDQIKAAKSGKKQLKATDAFKRLAKGLPETGVGFMYVSAKTGVAVQRMLMGMGRQSAEERLMMNQLGSGVPESLGVVQRVKDGYVMVNHASTSALRAVPLQLLVGQLAPAFPVGAIVMMPGIFQAREKAKRINCASNLKQIGLGCLMYSGDYNGAFPASFQDLVRQSLLVDGKVYGCPSLQKPARTAAGSDYVYVGAGQSDDNPKPTQTVLAYCDNHDNWINALFIDGHVQGWRSNDIRKLAKQKGLIINARAVRKKKGPVVKADLPEEQRKKVEALLKQLGAGDAATRKKAKQTLKDLGDYARPILEENINHPDVEIRMTVRDLLE